MRPTPTKQSRFRNQPGSLALPASRPGRSRRPRWLAGVVAAGVLALLGASAVPVGATPGADDTGAEPSGVVSPPAPPPNDDQGDPDSPDAGHHEGEDSSDAPGDEADRSAEEAGTDDPGMAALEEGDPNDGNAGATTGEHHAASTEAQVAEATLGGQTVQVAGLPWEDDDMGICDPDRDGWHFVLAVVQTLGGITPNASDFGPVTFTSTSGEGTAPFTDMTGPVAHFLDATGTIPTTASILAASMTFPETTSVTGFVQFRLSHSPCGDDGGNGNGDNGNGDNGNGDNGTDVTDDDNGTDVTDDDNGTDVTEDDNGVTQPDGNGEVVLATSSDAGAAPPTQASTPTSVRPTGGSLPVTGAAALPLALLALGLVGAGGAGWAASRRAGASHRSRTRT